MRRFTGAWVVPLLAGAAAAVTPVVPPATPAQDVVETYHGQPVHDPYRWLEQADAPAVRKWIDAQNRYADTVLSGFGDHGAIAKRAGELALTSTRRSSPAISANTLFYLRQTPPQQQAVLVAQAWPTGTATVLVDTNASQGSVAITGYWPSPDGARVAYGTATGGVRVPVTVVALGGSRPDGIRPTILEAYGGFSLAMQPAFIGDLLAWLERGGVYAFANIRGGGEYGESWHRDGSRANKQHVFDDLHAAARALVDAHWTDATHLGILGGSNGGLLMGGAITQHPADYRAAVSEVGIYDMLRAQLWPNGEYNTYEYGTVADATEFTWLYGYSPLHHVHSGTAYPAVLLITGENDPRVAPWQSRKFAAALQHANTSSHPILLITRRDEGHGVISSFSQRLTNIGVMLNFFAEELGLGTH